MVQIDEIDMKILQTLEHDSRTSLNEMSKMLNLSEAGIRKRVLALQEKKIIKKFTIEINPSKIGINSISLVGLDVEPTKMLGAIEKLCKFAEVRNLATSSGDHMIMMEIWTEDGKELTKFISEKVVSMDGVKRICPAIILEQFKE
jgi:Lrp/AsnC family transcriptional regulator, regulator for asnA, asnC and gidA